MQTTIFPPATIGILGSGQLGRMLAIAARQMGYRIHVLSPDSNSPTGQIADKEFTAAYEDLDAVRQFAQGVDVVTYEFENVPAETAVICQQFAPLRPGAHVLHVAQNRLREKQFFADNNLPVAPFIAVESLEDLVSRHRKNRPPRRPQNRHLRLRRQRPGFNRDTPIFNLQSSIFSNFSPGTVSTSNLLF